MAIGNPPLVELRHVVPADAARVVIKLESANPTGSMKDPVARALVECAAAEGRLSPRGTVVEYTAGTTGISLAFVCADAFSDEERDTMRAYGAEITDAERWQGNHRTTHQEDDQHCRGALWREQEDC